MRKPKRQIDYPSLLSSELVWLAQVDKDQRAFDMLYQQLIPVAQRIARNYARRYAWLDAEDISQEMLDVATIRRIIGGYRPGKATTWEKYAYFRLTYEGKDVLRKEDPCGISWPQKGKGSYPEWYRLGDKSFDNWDVAGRQEFDMEQRDLLAFHESIDAWRAAFAESRCEPKRTRVKQFAVVEFEKQSLGWCGLKRSFFGQRSKRKRSRMSLAEWRRLHAAPKQLQLF